MTKEEKRRKDLTKRLEYNTSEIVEMYRTAKDKANQIMILSQLNQCSCTRIKNELIAGGIKKSDLPSIRQGKKYPHRIAVGVKEEPILDNSIIVVKSSDIEDHVRSEMMDFDNYE